MITVEDVLDATVAVTGIKLEAILGQTRYQSVVQARHVAMYVARKRTPASYPELGRRFGDRDHTTVMTAVRNAEARYPAAIGEVERRLDIEPKLRCIPLVLLRVPEQGEARCA